jgi:hypothetical protein
VTAAGVGMYYRSICCHHRNRVHPVAGRFTLFHSRQMPVDRVTGDGTLKTAALFSPHISVSSDYRFIYYYILLSSVSSLSLTNKHRGFVGDSKDDSKKCCHLMPSSRFSPYQWVAGHTPLHPVNPSRHQPIGCLRAMFTGCLPRQSADPEHHGARIHRAIMLRGGLPRAACCCRQHSVGWYG